jgi:heme-degrading monooxygenase HmoA
LLEEVSKKGIYFTYSIWDSEEDLELYLRSDLFKMTWQSVKPLFAAKAKAWSTFSVELFTNK